MTKKEYSKLLNTNAWKNKRMIILTRDGFKCTKCEKSDCILHVHHKIYIAGRNPWEYNNKHLITLCKECHDEIHRTKKIKRYVKEPSKPKKKKKNIIINSTKKRYGFSNRDNIIQSKWDSLKEKGII